MHLQIEPGGDAGLQQRFTGGAAGAEPGERHLQIGDVEPGLGEQFGAAGIELIKGTGIEASRQAEGDIARGGVEHQKLANRAGIEIEAEADLGVDIDTNTPVGLDVEGAGGDIDVSKIVDQLDQAVVLFADAPIKTIAKVELKKIEKWRAHRRIVLRAFAGESIGAGAFDQGEGDVTQACFIHRLVEAVGPFIGGQDVIGEAAHRVGHGGEASAEIFEAEAQRFGDAIDQRIAAEIAHQGIAERFDAIGEAGEHRQPVGGTEGAFIKAAERLVQGIADGVDGIVDRIHRGADRIAGEQEIEQSLGIELEAAGGISGDLHRAQRHESLIALSGEAAVIQLKRGGRLQAEQGAGVGQLDQRRGAQIDEIQASGPQPQATGQGGAIYINGAHLGEGQLQVHRLADPLPAATRVAFEQIGAGPHGLEPQGEGARSLAAVLEHLQLGEGVGLRARNR